MLKAWGGNVIALNISTDEAAMEKLKFRWSQLNTDMHLIAKYSPYRAVVTPLLENIELIAETADDDEKVTVVLPQFITHESWSGFLHNHTSLFIRETLLRNSNIIVATYPYHLDYSDDSE